MADEKPQQTDGAAEETPQQTDGAQSGEGEKETSRRARLYGRKWKILIYKPAYKDEEKKERDPEQDTEIDVSLLRCVFRTQQTYQNKSAVCTLVVYNMNAATEGEIIREGFQIRIEGGYEEGQYGEIFTGDILQVVRNREDGVDYRLEILAFRGVGIFDNNFTRLTMAAGSKPRDVVDAIAQNAREPIEVGEVSDGLEKAALPRGKVLFGTPAKYLRDLTIGNDAYYWQGEDGKLTVKKPTDEIPEDQCLALTPATGLVGTPQYGDDGIHIKMLLDARVKLETLIKIDNELIRRQLVALNLGDGSKSQTPQANQFDQDGEYAVYSVSHTGDTWGDEWYTDVVGIGRLGRAGLPTSLDTPEQTLR